MKMKMGKQNKILGKFTKKKKKSTTWLKEKYQDNIESGDGDIPMPHININFYDNVILSLQQSDEFNFINFTQEVVLESFLNVKSNAVGYGWNASEVC